MPTTREVKFRKLFIVSSAAIAAGSFYTAYLLYNSEYLAEKRRRWDKFYKSLTALSDALSSSSDISATITADLQRFLHSDSDDVPQSVRQLLKLSRCAEFQVAVTRLSGAVTQGIVKGITATTGDLRTAALSVAAVPLEGTTKLTLVEGRSPVITLPEKLLDKVFSEAGKGFATAVVGKAVRSLVHAYFDYAGKAATRQARGSAGQGLGTGVFATGQTEGEDNKWPKACLDIASSEKGKELISIIVSSFAASAVDSFLEKTNDVNMYDDMVSSITKEQYKEPMTEILKSVCGGAVESLVRTSHDVLTTDPDVKQACTSRCPSPYKAASSEAESLVPRNLISSGQNTSYDDKCSMADSDIFTSPSSSPYPSPRGRQTALQQTNWQAEVGKLLGRPETRQLVVDVAGAMSSQGVRAFSAVCMDMLRTMGGAKAVEHDGIGNRSTMSSVPNPLAPLRAVAGRALTASSVCLALCLHMVTGTQSTHVPGGVLLDGFHGG